MLERRMQKLSEFGIYGDVNSSLLQAITEEQGAQLRQAISVRGLTSLEAATIRESRDRYKRALNCGYLNVEDRSDMALTSNFVTGSIRRAGR